MKIKVQNTTNTQLDWLVAKSLGHIHPDGGWYAGNQGRPLVSYSTNWAQGGPIIEREKIDVFCSGAIWDASTGDRSPNVIATGPTPLVAAMRCFVCSRLGENVEVPDELCE